ncbi:SusC/RagA family TonB-linked outer membrane protein [Pedobacter sp. MC2016-14]|uniref:SusC/RagA family TonB-linked outer membrane protein n=1 Tax=Pedobacter sp. MC2016-14 TaxID=2897327 RepID=UPI001E35BBAE|nr:SusC/RagA family TonB-linked outer membrane protein [Pedobacter sp. MC2016-14]MCD0490577.1 SusC/RagA family TonB-linked outer membrane protein [Pedobacter sp. MC2016-14]
MIKIYLSRVMKTIICLMLTGFMSVSAASYSQQITLKGRNIPFAKVVEAIRKQSGYTVFGTKKLFEASKPVTIDAQNMPLTQFLEKVTENQPLEYAIEDKTISLSSRKAAKTTPEPAAVIQQQVISGTVRHAETKELLIGATVRLKGTPLTAGSNTKGQYRITIPLSAKKQILVFSYVGMKTLEIPYQKQESIDVDLQPDEAGMDELVVTGIYQRERKDFTGSSARYTVKDLQMIGNQNILQSLKTLDPSFAIIDNNQFGSNPNRLPDIEIRGKSSVIGLTDEFSSNPNQPLFILDGFESTLRLISDLSMDRVESITVLKDASATAIYGSKAANGVVVIETKRPTPGQLRLNYTLNSTVSFADLTDYNLMNAEEKLQFELLSRSYGALTPAGNIILGNNLESEAVYFNRLKEVRRGVNTDWTSEPLRVALSQRHSIFAEGGDASLRYSTSFNYGITKGVMKGSDRQATNGNIRLLYRKGKISVNNSLSIDNTQSDQEAIPFSTFSRANPYYRKYDAQGNVLKVLEDFKYYANPTLAPIYSPLYNQSNLNINKEGTLGFTNNTELEWRIIESLRARGRFSIRSFSNQDVLFRSPFNTEFENVDAFQKGTYYEYNGKNLNYDGDFSLTFGKLFAEKHMVNAVLGTRMEQAISRESIFGVSGFTDDEFSNPNFALGYVVGRRAEYVESKRRGASFFMNAGYAYDQRFLLDATIRSDGSSVFGSARQFSNIWSVGLGWNIHNEAFLKDGNFSWLNELKLRGSIGNPANQNFNDYISMRVYKYNNENRNPFGASTILSNMGNKNLKWQTTLDRNVGLNLTILDNRLRFTGDYFVKTTDPLLVYVALPSSTGVTRVAQNLGEQITKGFTVITDYAVLRGKQLNWRVNLNMRQLKAEYRKIGNQLNSFNTTNKSRNLLRYYDGGSPSDLWAVRSKGIDPATGREIFLNKNGEQTFVHNYQDEVIVGNSDPKLEGVLGTSFLYKGFSAQLSLRYRVGGQAFMQTLYEKVENISSTGVMLNQDRRALYDRWKQPGDNAKFKAISTTELTPMSSRFVADNNTLIGESFSLGYETTSAAWLKTIRASSITFRAYMNDIFNISTIKNERGIDYPFARSVSFSAAVRF